MTHINPYMYESKITRVRDVYGRFYWIATRQLEEPGRAALLICNGRGLKRINTKAGNDNQNIMHRDNIAEVLQERKIEL